MLVDEQACIPVSVLAQPCHPSPSSDGQGKRNVGWQASSLDSCPQCWGLQLFQDMRLPMEMTSTIKRDGRVVNEQEELKHGDNNSACLCSYRALSGKGNNNKKFCGMVVSCFGVLWSPKHPQPRLLSETAAQQWVPWSLGEGSQTNQSMDHTSLWRKVLLWRDLQNLFHLVTEFLLPHVENNVL